MRSPALGPRRKVLFVEDESTLRRTYKRFFAERYHLAFAASGTEARRQMDEFRPEVLVLDLRLPDTDGITLLQEIRQSQPSLPVIVTTSRSEEHTSELQSQSNLVCRLLLEKKKKTPYHTSDDNRIKSITSATVSLTDMRLVLLNLIKALEPLSSNDIN